MKQEIFILKKDTPYHDKGTEFYEDMGYLRTIEYSYQAYRLSQIAYLKKWFKIKKK